MTQSLNNPHTLIYWLQTHPDEDIDTLQEVVDQLEKHNTPLNDIVAGDLLRRAIEQNNISHVRFWMTKTQNLKIHRYMCLHQHKFELFEVLLENHSNTSDILDHALVEMAAHNNIDAVNFLIENGANPSYMHHLALHQAIENGANTALRLIEFINPSNASLILASAVTHENMAVLQQLLERGIDPLTDDSVSLYRAFQCRNLSVVECLLQYTQTVPSEVIDDAFASEARSEVLHLFLDKCCMKDVERNAHSYSDQARQHFEQICAQRQKQTLTTHITPSTQVGRNRKI